MSQRRVSFLVRGNETICLAGALLLLEGSVVRGQIFPMESALYSILIRDADGRELELENFQDLESARLRLPSIAAKYPGTKLTLWNRHTRAILAETDGY